MKTDCNKIPNYQIQCHKHIWRSIFIGSLCLQNKPDVKTY